MLNALNTKLLIAIYVLLCSIASSAAYQNHRQVVISAQKAAFDAKWNAAEQNAKQPDLGIGDTIKNKKW